MATAAVRLMWVRGYGRLSRAWHPGAIEHVHRIAKCHSQRVLGEGRDRMKQAVAPLYKVLYERGGRARVTDVCTVAGMSGPTDSAMAAMEGTPASNFTALPVALDTSAEENTSSCGDVSRCDERYNSLTHSTPF